MLFACAVGFELFSNAKTFFINKIIVDEMFFILKKNKKVYLQVEWSNVSFKVTQNNNYFFEKIILDFYVKQSKNHIIRVSNKDLSKDVFEEFIFDETDEITTFGEFNKLTYDALFAKYGILIFAGVFIAIIAILIHVK